MLNIILKYEDIKIIIVQLTKKLLLAARHAKRERVLVAWEEFAMRMGGVAIPVVRRYILPEAKKPGRNFFEAAIPENCQVLAGKVKTSAEIFRPLERAERCTADGRMAREPVAGEDTRRTGTTNRKRRNISAASLPDNDTNLFQINSR